MQGHVCKLKFIVNKYTHTHSWIKHLEKFQIQYNIKVSSNNSQIITAVVNVVQLYHNNVLE